MSEPIVTADVINTIEKYAGERGIQLPPIDPFPEQQPIYERYIRSMGLNPDQVDRIVDPKRLPEQNQAKIHAAVLQLMLSLDKMEDETLRIFLMYLRFHFGETRASSLLRSISQPLFETCSGEIVSSGYSVAIGVMPMRWFNGQSSPFGESALCLASTGSIDLIEIFCILFMVNRKNPQYALHHMRTALDTYVKTGRVKPPEFGLAEGLHDYSDYKGENGVSVHMTTAAERFLVAHELGHVALRHLAGCSIGAVPYLVPKEKTSIFSRFSLRKLAEGSRSVQVIQPAHSDEYCADQWAFSTMFRTAQLSNEPEEKAFYCAGASIFLGLALLIEAASRAAGIKIPDTHPSALSRLYLVQLSTELHGCNEHAYLAERTCEFVEEVGSIYAGFEMPPMLSRELNNVALEVFQKMKYDLDKAPYITEFL